MNTQPSVAVLANCTHASLAAALRKSGLFSEVESFEVYTIPPENREATADSLARYDLILTLEHGEGFGALSTTALRSRFGDRVSALPTPFFSALMPDMAYLTLRGKITRAPGILGDYHSALILAECLDGLDEESIVRRYADGSAFDRIDLEGVWEDGIGELCRREEQCEIRISDYIRSRRNEGVLGNDFLSFNHPTEALINHIVRSFVDRTVGPASHYPPLLASEHNLYHDARWPLHPAVAARLGLHPPVSPSFKSPNRLGGVVMSIADFARRSCMFLRSTAPAGHFKIHTPWYLANRLHPLPGNPSETVGHRNINTGKQIVINHFGRSGSTVLAMMLQQHPSIAWLHEFFSHYSIKSLATYNFTRDEMVRMLTEAVEREKSSKQGICVGHEIKLMNFLQNPGCDIEEYLAALADPERFFHIVLLRKNTLRRILSVYKAMQTKIYHAQDDAYRQSHVTYTVDLSKLFDHDTGQQANTLPALLEKAQAREEAVLGIYRNLSIPFHVLTYEDDIESSPRMAYDKVIRWMDLPNHDARITLSRTGAPLCEEVSNYAEVAESLKGSPFEWMLEDAEVGSL